MSRACVRCFEGRPCPEHPQKASNGVRIESDGPPRLMMIVPCHLDTHQRDHLRKELSDSPSLVVGMPRDSLLYQLVGDRWSLVHDTI